MFILFSAFFLYLSLWSFRERRRGERDSFTLRHLGWVLKKFIVEEPRIVLSTLCVVLLDQWGSKHFGPVGYNTSNFDVITHFLGFFIFREIYRKFSEIGSSYLKGVKVPCIFHHLFLPLAICFLFEGGEHIEALLPGFRKFIFVSPENQARDIVVNLCGTSFSFFLEHMKRKKIKA